MTVLTSVGIALLFIALFAPHIAGAVIARRAWRRNGWPEARLAFRAFVAGPVIYIAASITLPLAGWLTGSNSVFDVLQALTVLFAAAYGVVTIAIAVALYRLARRSARPDAPADLQRVNRFGRATG